MDRAFIFLILLHGRSVVVYRLNTIWASDTVRIWFINTWYLMHHCPETTQPWKEFHQREREGGGVDCSSHSPTLKPCYLCMHSVTCFMEHSRTL